MKLRVIDQLLRCWSTWVDCQILLTFWRACKDLTTNRPYPHHGVAGIETRYPALQVYPAARTSWATVVHGAALRTM